MTLNAPRWLARLILLILLTGSLTKVEAQNSKDKNESLESISKTEVFEMNTKIVTPFIVHPTVPSSMRESCFRNIENFHDTGPHIIYSYMLGEIYLGSSGCNFLIDVIDRETGKILNSLLVHANLKKKLYEGSSVSLIVDNVTYKFIIGKCPTCSIFKYKNGLIIIERTVIKEPTIDIDNLSWKMTGKFKKVKNAPRIVKVDWAAKKIFNAEMSDSRKVGFEKGYATVTSQGVESDKSVILIPGILEYGGSVYNEFTQEVNTAREAEFGQIKTNGEGVILDGGKCKEHLVWTIDVSEYGKVSAPSLGITNELEFTVLRAFFYESLALCDEKSGSNEPDPKLVEKAKKEIETFKVKHNKLYKN